MSDQLSLILERFSLRAGVFYSGKLCGMFDYGDHEQQEGHLHILRAGRIRFKVKNGDTIELNEPGVVFFPRPQPHTMIAEVSDDANVICATIKYGVGVNNPLTQTLPPFILLNMCTLPAVEIAINGMITEAFPNLELGGQEIMNRYMEVFLIAVFRQLISSGQTRGGLLAGLSDPSLSKALTIMHEKPNERWSLQELAEAACQSRSKFALEFKRLVGIPPLEYLTQWRVNLAKTLLLKGKQVTYVAAEVGYDSASSLTKAFKKIEGQTPRGWLSSV